MLLSKVPIHLDRGPVVGGLPHEVGGPQGEGDGHTAPRPPPRPTYSTPNLWANRRPSSSRAIPPVRKTVAPRASAGKNRSPNSESPNSLRETHAMSTQNGG